MPNHGAAHNGNKTSYAIASYNNLDSSTIRAILENVEQKRVYSYIRFSSALQEQGDSVRRQLELRDKVLKEHRNWVLDETPLEDYGISAYLGKNIENGALGVFIKLCEAGKIPRGSVLIVEQWDRLSRLPALDAIAVFSRISNCGVDICTAADGKVHSRESMQKTGNLLESVLKMQLANEESQKKADRIRESQQKNRASGKPIPGRCPAWIKLKDGKFEFIPERAEIVRQIFQMTADGVGMRQICDKFNKAKLECWGPGTRKGKAWWPCVISSILHSEAVIGRFLPFMTELHQVDSKNERGEVIVVPKWVRVPYGTVRENYFPPAIDMALWQKVQTGLDGSKKISKTNQQAAGRVGAGLVQNLFTGICFDGLHPDCTMQIINKNLQSDYNRREPDSKPVRWNIVDLEDLVLKYLIEFDFSSLAEPKPASVEQLALAEARSKHQSVAKQSERLLKLARTTDDPPPSLLIDLQKLREQESKLKAELAVLEAAVTRTDRASDEAKNAQEEIKSLMHRKDRDTRLRLRAEIRRLITRIDVFPLGWDEEGFDTEPVILIVLKNATHRWVSKEGITLEIDQETVRKAVEATPNRGCIQSPAVGA